MSVFTDIQTKRPMSAHRPAYACHIDIHCFVVVILLSLCILDNFAFLLPSENFICRNIKKKIQVSGLELSSQLFAKDSSVS